MEPIAALHNHHPPEPRRQPQPASREVTVREASGQVSSQAEIRGEKTEWRQLFWVRAFLTPTLASTNDGTLSLQHSISLHLMNVRSIQIACLRSFPLTQIAGPGEWQCGSGEVTATHCCHCCILSPTTTHLASSQSRTADCSQRRCPTLQTVHGALWLGCCGSAARSHSRGPLQQSKPPEGWQSSRQPRTPSGWHPGW